MICRATVIPETDEDAFNKVNFSQSTLYVPEASLEAYRTTAPWSEFKNIVPITPSGINAQTATNQTTMAISSTTSLPSELKNENNKYNKNNLSKKTPILVFVVFLVV